MQNPLSVGRFWEREMPTPNGKTMTLRFLVTHTVGCKPETITMTVLQFLHAVKVLILGMETDETVVSQWQAPTHMSDANHCTISHADIPVWQGEDKEPFMYSINRFTEWYCADKLVAEVGFGVVDVVAIMQKYGVEPSNSRFPARKAGNGSNTPKQLNQGANGDTPIYGDFPGKAHCRENHAGQVIRCNMAQVAVNMVDGKRQYVIHSSYQEGVSQYPMAYTGDEFVKHQPTVQWLRSLDYGTHPINKSGVFYVNVKQTSKTNPQTGEQYLPTYINLNKIDFTDDEIKALQEAAEMNQAPPPDDNADFASDEIPWEDEQPTPENDTPF
jgi:hypothetical protein